jgi:S-adenosylmethionine:tRNA ribosyltransferase-isomerase
MLLSNFDFYLPDKLIATHPCEPRDSAKLLVANRTSGDITHSHFYDLPNFLRKGDFLVFNSSKVIPARLFGEVDGKNIEVLLTSPCHSERSDSEVEESLSNERKGFLHSSPCEVSRNDKSNLWEAKAKPGKRLKNGSGVIFNDQLSAEVVDTEEGTYKLKFNLAGNKFWQEIDMLGEMPLPPYILKQRHKKHDERVDSLDYQCVYADKPGSVAAPTAGLHFTEELLEKIQDKGCDIGFVDLHVGLGTFEPIRTETVEDHKIHSEHFELSADLARNLNQAKKEGRRVIAVGTTTVRVLESCQKDGFLEPKSGETSIYIYPGYKFGFVDAIITNFHLPKSSLLLLVSAFWTREKVLEAYNEAIKNDYRFYSYGDGMFIT